MPAEAKRDLLGFPKVESYSGNHESFLKMYKSLDHVRFDYPDFNREIKKYFLSFANVKINIPSYLYDVKFPSTSFLPPLPYELKNPRIKKCVEPRRPRIHSLKGDGLNAL